MQEEIIKSEEEIKREKFQSTISTYAKQIESLISNNLVISQKKNPFSKKFTSENVGMYLENPIKFERELRQLSLVLMTISPQYAQICNYLASISKFIPIVTPNMNKFTNVKNELIDPEKLKKEYLKCCEYVDMMKIPHTFQQIMEVITRDDVYYGYCVEDKDSFYIMQLDSDFCKISSITEGCFNFSFNFEYFDKNKNIKDISEDGEGVDLLDYFPKEFNEKYNRYKVNNKLKWQELSDANTVCIKFSEMLGIVFPRYASLFNDLSDLKTYKELGKAKAESDIYKFIALEMKTMGDEVDDFTTSIETVMQFYSLLNSNLPDGVGAFISPTTVKDISFSSNAVTDKSNIINAESSVYTSSGISEINFGKGASNAGTAKISNMIDESMLFKIYRQFERVLSKKIGRMFNNKFSIRLLDVTTLSLSEEIDKQLKLAQYSVPNKLILCALAGISQQQEQGMSALEEILDLTNKWKPLTSSHTTTGEEDGGRPTKDDKDLTDSGQESRDTSVVDNRV